MTPLAKQALNNARQASAPAQKLIVPILANEPLPEIVITGPINRVMELEGKRYAVDFVQGLGTDIRNPKVVAKAIADLTRYAAAQPSSVASGIKLVIDLLKGA
jgi:hypothetical protein